MPAIYFARAEKTKKPPGFLLSPRARNIRLSRETTIYTVYVSCNVKHHEISLFAESARIHIYIQEIFAIDSSLWRVISVKFRSCVILLHEVACDFMRSVI